MHHPEKAPQAQPILLSMRVTSTECIPLLFLSPGRPGLWSLRWVAVMHHVQRTSGNMKIMTQEAGLWLLGTLPLWMQWDFQSPPTANGRTVKNILRLHLFLNNPACLVHHSSEQSVVLDAISAVK